MTNNTHFAEGVKLNNKERVIWNQLLYLKYNFQHECQICGVKNLVLLVCKKTMNIRKLRKDE